MSKKTTYTCNLCYEEETVAKLIGFTVSSRDNKLLATFDAGKVNNHLCGRCFNQVGQIYNENRARATAITEEKQNEQQQNNN